MATVAVGRDVGLEIIMWPWLGLENFWSLALGREETALASSYRLSIADLLKEIKPDNSDSIF